MFAVSPSASHVIVDELLSSPIVVPVGSVTAPAESERTSDEVAVSVGSVESIDRPLLKVWERFSVRWRLSVDSSYKRKLGADSDVSLSSREERLGDNLGASSESLNSCTNGEAKSTSLFSELVPWQLHICAELQVGSGGLGSLEARGSSRAKKVKHLRSFWCLLTSDSTIFSQGTVVRILKD
eukprot:gb/GECG01003827.1/.p1 GENE.gb/GECG01003827.1/~~gb/GECG01003827.1/.p1  ORF type:complete len:182 (+),score=11.49 gb/GECG01003827.1/:1-546(+)